MTERSEVTGGHGTPAVSGQSPNERRDRRHPNDERRLEES
ncbi:hypothetical protein GCM10010485_63180 [Streptosporangium carneum]